MDQMTVNDVREARYRAQAFLYGSDALAVDRNKKPTDIATEVDVLTAITALCQGSMFMLSEAVALATKAGLNRTKVITEGLTAAFALTFTNHSDEGRLNTNEILGVFREAAQAFNAQLVSGRLNEIKLIIIRGELPGLQQADSFLGSLLADTQMPGRVRAKDLLNQVKAAIVAAQNKQATTSETQTLVANNDIVPTAIIAAERQLEIIFGRNPITEDHFKDADVVVRSVEVEPDLRNHPRVTEMRLQVNAGREKLGNASTDSAPTPATVTP